MYDIYHLISWVSRVISGDHVQIYWNCVAPRCTKCVLDNSWRVFLLTHWGRVTHICVGKLTIIGSDNGLSPEQRQAIIWTNAGILLIGPLGTNFSEILIEIQTFSLKKIRLKMSSAKCCSFCLGLNVLKSKVFTVQKRRYVLLLWHALFLLFSFEKYPYGLLPTEYELYAFPVYILMVWCYQNVNCMVSSWNLICFVLYHRCRNNYALSQFIYMESHCHVYWIMFCLFTM